MAGTSVTEKLKFVDLRLISEKVDAVSMAYYKPLDLQSDVQISYEIVAENFAVYAVIFGLRITDREERLIATMRYQYDVVYRIHSPVTDQELQAFEQNRIADCAFAAEGGCGLSHTAYGLADIDAGYIPASSLAIRTLAARWQGSFYFITPSCYYVSKAKAVRIKKVTMNKVASYLQEHVSGEVMTSPSVRRYFSTDGGVFEVTPTLVMYPKNTNDVRKVTRFTWQLAEKGHVLPITPRGRGSDQAGAAIGKGIVLVFPAHMRRILELDTKQRLARVQPGVNYRTFQDAIKTHGLFLPPYPSSIDFATLGGAIANNTAGEKTVKYGATRQYVDSLEVVLANGELIQTGRINKRELNHKKGQTNFEGEVYRQLDNLITDNWDLLQQQASQPNVSKNAAGYALSEVKHADGSFDLTPLLVGSQGTLGIVTEAIFRLQPFNPRTTLFAAYFKDLASASQAVPELMALEPSALEMVDSHLLEFIGRINPARLKGLVEKPYPAIVLLLEFDDAGDRKQHAKAKKAEKILGQHSERYAQARDLDDQERLWSLRHSAAEVITHVEGNSKALPIIEDGVVPREQFETFIQRIYELFEKYHLEVAVWGHAGDANVHLQPFLDLSKVGDRQKVFKIMDEYYAMVLEMGGSTCGEHNDGRLRAPYLPKVYGQDMYNLFREVKRIFDPFGTLNPGVKIDVTKEATMPLLRKEYSMEHLYDHLPHM
jgi:FAD/FMN-containing dehydrogenase